MWEAVMERVENVVSSFHVDLGLSLLTLGASTAMFCKAFSVHTVGSALDFYSYYLPVFGSIVVHSLVWLAETVSWYYTGVQHMYCLMGTASIVCSCVIGSLMLMIAINWLEISSNHAQVSGQSPVKAVTMFMLFVGSIELGHIISVEMAEGRHGDDCNIVHEARRHSIFFILMQVFFSATALLNAISIYQTTHMGLMQDGSRRSARSSPVNQTRLTFFTAHRPGLMTDSCISLAVSLIYCAVVPALLLCAASDSFAHHVMSHRLAEVLEFLTFKMTSLLLPVLHLWKK